MGRRRYQKPSVLKTFAKRPQWYYRIVVDVLVDRDKTERREKWVYLGYVDEIGKREAEKLRDLKLVEVNNTPALIQSQVRFADLAKTYKESHVRGLKPSTQLSYTAIIDHYILPHFEHARLFEVDPLTTQKWIYSMEDAGLALNTRKTNAGVLRSIFDWALDFGYYNGRNPCRKLKYGNGGDVFDRRALKANEVSGLLESLPDPLRLMAELSFYLGLRISEVLGLTWGALDLKSGLLAVRQGKAQDGRLATPKSVAGRRGLELGFLTDRFRRPDGVSDAALVFPDVTYGQVRDELRRRAKDAGIEFKGFGFHTLRRTYATARTVTASFDQDLSRDMGHSSDAMTQRYIRAGSPVERLQEWTVHSRENLGSKSGIVKKTRLVRSA